jgi:hypothetical protein
VRIIETVDESRFFVAGYTLGFGEGIVVVVSVKYCPGAIPLHPRYLNERGMSGHDDRGGNTEALTMKGDGHAVVSGARRDDSGIPLLRGQEQKTIEGASFLERAGHLEVFQFEENAVAGHPADGFRMGAWGKIDLVPNALAGRFNIGERYHVAGV